MIAELDSRQLPAYWAGVHRCTPAVSAGFRRSSPGCPSSINSGDQGNLLDARARCQGVAKMQPGKGLHLVRREARRSSCRVLPLDLRMHRSDSSIILAHLLRPLQAECRVDPVGDARQPRTIVDRDPERPVEDPASINTVVDLFVLEQAIGMDTRTGDIEPGAGK